MGESVVVLAAPAVRSLGDRSVLRSGRLRVVSRSAHGAWVLALDTSTLGLVVGERAAQDALEIALPSGAVVAVVQDRVRFLFARRKGSTRT